MLGSRPRHPAIMAVGVACLTMVTPGTAPGSGAATRAPLPALRLMAGAPRVTVQRRTLPDGTVFAPRLDLDTFVVSSGAPFEVRVSRDSYHDPIRAEQIVPQESGRYSRPLPTGPISSFVGLPDFFHITLRDGSGATVEDRTQAFCPDSRTIRVDDSAPTSSPYPLGCPTNPFTLGSVWGIQQGWGAATVDPVGGPVTLADGDYTATIGVTQRYLRLLGVAGGTKTVQVHVETVRDQTSQPGAPDASTTASRSSTAPGRSPTSSPASRSGPPAPGSRPDLRPLPAWGISVRTSGGSDYLSFAADVWNAGPAPFVVNGFRRPGTDTMDAYQYFFDARGEQTGAASIGTLEWDPRPGHQHWHLSDVAEYSLLDSSRREVTRSQKDGFCLANTDAVDYLVKNADWQPGGSDLHTACGEPQAQSIRELLAVGSGDTYVQGLPGQAFDISDLPNGVYYIRITANPDHNLYETDRHNDVSLRTVILGGARGARTVKVPPYQLVAVP